MITSLVVIPILGCLKNYVKYKKISLLLFLRTPFIYVFLYSFMKYFKYKNIVSKVIINERIIMFVYKIFISLLTDSYHKKKLKYKKKYNLPYNSNESLKDIK
tara:strand:+ start:128 stop:433 length:306 start_codon:yes stop_codon:yes gene_type:complete